MHRMFKVALYVCLCLLPAGVWANSGVSPNVLVLPSGPGSLGGVGENVKINLNMGLMSYAIPLRVPAGRNGLNPKLSLQYSSAAGSSAAGIGWTLTGISTVERLTVRGLPRYGSVQDPVQSGEDRFYSGGELVQISGTPYYRARFEGGFIRYRWHHTGDQKGYWTAEFPDGSIAFYGGRYKQNAARKVDASQATVDVSSQVSSAKGTFRWMLTSMIDPNGNRLEYKYFRDGSQVYLESAQWVFDKDNKPLYQMQFEYETRPDVISDGKPGFELLTTKRIKKIRSLSAGTDYRSYVLEYDQKSYLSRLVKVTQFGNDKVSAYPVKFTMTYSSADYTQDNAQMVSMPTSLAQNFVNGNSDLVDINGDGLPDVIDTSKSTHRFHLNTMTLKDLKQDKHDYQKPYENPKETSGAQLSNRDVQMLDFNGDGFVDLVSAVTKTILLNLGKGKWENASESLQSSFPSPGANPNRRFFDFNGDKAIDIIEIIGGSVVYWVSDGKGSWKKVTGTQQIGADFATDQLRLIDMNGDNLSDAVQIFEGKLRYKKYLGYGKWSTNWTVIPVQGLTQSLSKQVRFADVNGDGMADMVAFIANSIKFFVNRNGTQFDAARDLNKNFKGVPLPDSDPSSVSVRIADINGNGSRDIVWLDSSGKITYLELFKLRPNLLTTIDNGIGKKIEVTYGSSVYHYLRDQSLGKAWPSKLPMAFVVVNQIKTYAARADGSDKGACPMIQNVYYHDGYYDGVEKKFRGFRTVESVFESDKTIGCKTDSHGKRREVLKFYVGDGDTSSGDNDLYYHGKLREQSTTGTSHAADKDLTFSSQSYEWGECKVDGSTTTLTPKVRYICLKAREISLKEGETDASKWKTTRIEYEYDGYGNNTLTKIHGLKDVEGDERFFKKTFITPDNPNDPDVNKRWFLNKLQKVEFCEKEAGPCASRETFYDGEAYKGLPAGELVRGNITRESAKASSDGKVIDLYRYAYDEFGNVIGRMSPRGNIKQTEFDTLYNLFPAKSILKVGALTLTQSAVYDFRYSVIRSSTDWNGNKIFYGHDAFGRLLSSTRPGDDLTKPTTTYEYDMKAPLSVITTKRRSKRNGAQDTIQKMCFDGMGRLVQIRSKLADGKFLVESHKEYNSQSKVARLAKAYESTSAECTFDIPDHVKTVSTQYDGLGRMIKRTLEDGTFKSVVYQPLKVMRYDQEDNTKGSAHFDTPQTDEFDGLGRLMKRTELDKPGHPIVTQYTWTHLNVYGDSQLAKVIDAKGNEKVQSYDMLGRITKVVDPDRQTTTYKYDDAGNMIERTDDRGITIAATYDDLDRPLTIEEKGKPETQISFVYDTTTKEYASKFTKLRIVAIKSPHIQSYYTYNNRGQLVGVRRNTLGHDFDFGFGYDNIDRLTSKTFPDGRRLTYQFDANDRLTGVPDMIKNITRNEFGILNGWTLANNVRTELTHDATRRITGFNIQNVTEYKYTYDNMGNFLSITTTESGAEEKQTFQYDSLYRLTQATLGTSETMTYKFDDLGNLTTKTSSLQAKSPSHVGDYGYAAGRSNMASKVGSVELTHDKAGFLKKSGTSSYDWDFLGRLLEVKKDGTVAMKAWYDAENNRFLKEEDGIHTLYVMKGYELRGGAAVINVFLGKQRVVGWRNFDAGATFFDDLAPAEGSGATLTPKPDKKLNVADAWLYHAARQNIIKVPLKERKPNVDLTMDMLEARVSRLLVEKPEEKHYYHTNHLGSTVAVTNQAGEVLSRKTYYPFGSVRSATGHVFSYGFMTTERDKSTKLNYATARYLNAKWGMWISADPLFEKIRGVDDEFNSYWYASNNPLRFIDSQGTESVTFDDWGPGIFQGTVILGVAGVSAVAAFKNRNQGNNLSAWGGVAAGLVSFLGLGMQIGGTVKDDSALMWVGVGIEVAGAVGAAVLAYMSERQARKTEAALTNDKDALKRENSNLQKRKDSLVAKNTNLGQEKTSLQNQLKNAEAEVKRLKTQIERETPKTKTKTKTRSKSNSSFSSTKSKNRISKKRKKP